MDCKQAATIAGTIPLHNMLYALSVYLGLWYQLDHVMVLLRPTQAMSSKRNTSQEQPKT